MFALIGVMVVLVSVIVGYLMHHGNLAVLIQINEFVILGGCGIGSMISAYGMSGFMTTVKAAIGNLKPDPYSTKQVYVELLKMMYQLFNVARKEGLLGLEKHIEDPHKSEIIGKCASFLSNHHAEHFFCDTLKVILTGAVGPHDLADMMEMDLEIAHAESKLPAEAIQTVGDGMPAFGIVAAVLGVIITMGKIGGEAAAIGMSVAAALVGTFLGILLAYGVFAPLSKALETRGKNEEQYMNCIRFALHSFARGESPITCIEFSRRNIVPSVRPGFSELEAAVKEKAA